MTTFVGRRLRPVAALGLLIVAVASCGGNRTTGGEGGDLGGVVKVDGSSTVAPLTTAAAEFFQEQNPRVQVTVGTSGTGGGFEKFCNGETDVSDASRPIKAEERQACEKNGVRYEQFTVANDALTVVVNKANNWADCLTVDQLKRLWAPGSRVNNWNQIDPKFPNVPLKLFGAGTDSGTFDFFTEQIVGKEGASRTDYSPSEDDNVTVQGVAGSKGGMGYFGFSYFEENQDKLKALKIDGGNGCVAPSSDAARDGTYEPLSRPLFIYPKAASLNRPEVETFVEYYVENHKKIAEDAQFIPLNAEQESELRDALAKLKSRAS